VVPVKMVYVRKYLALVLAVVLLPALVAGAAISPEMIRVALFRGIEAVRVEGAGILLTDLKGEPVRATTPLDIRRGRDNLTVNGARVAGLIISSPAYITVNGKRYRGILECQPEAKGMLVINKLPLEEYLVGLINCEISSQWPMESVKAQAVIARSYALYQKNARRSALYDLESSVMDQVYQGSDIEDSRAGRGVEETAGEVLTFDGNVIQAYGSGRECMGLPAALPAGCGLHVLRDGSVVQVGAVTPPEKDRKPAARSRIQCGRVERHSARNAERKRPHFGTDTSDIGGQNDGACTEVPHGRRVYHHQKHQFRGYNGRRDCYIFRDRIWPWSGPVPVGRQAACRGRFRLPGNPCLLLSRCPPFKVGPVNADDFVARHRGTRCPCSDTC